MRLLTGFDVARHVDGADCHQRQAAVVAPAEKLLTCARIGSSRVRVADVGGEEFHIAPSRLVAGDQRRHQMDVVRGGERAGFDNGRKLVSHFWGPTMTVPHGMSTLWTIDP